MSENLHEVLNSQNSDIQDDSNDDSAGVDGVIEVGEVKVSLLERELWEQFSKLGTEMIMTKAGSGFPEFYYNGRNTNITH